MNIALNFIKLEKEDRSANEFIDNPDKYLCVDRIDRTKTNNVVNANSLGIRCRTWNEQNKTEQIQHQIIWGILG